MKKIKNITLLTMALLMLVACQNKNTVQIGRDVTSMNPHEFTDTVGIAKIIAHPALDDVQRGIKDELIEAGYVNLKLDMQNANGEISAAFSIANKYRSDKASVVVGISTPIALALANNIKETPVIFTAITDPIDAGLRTDINSESSNITGVSDLTPVMEQIRMANDLLKIKRLGFIYNAGESNSIALLKMTQDACKELGIELISTVVSNTSEVKQATQFLAPKVDAIYATTDNVVIATRESVVTTAMEYNVPVIDAAPVAGRSTGALIAYGINYYNAGRQTGKLVIRVLRGENPGQIPVVFLNSPEELTLNIDLSVAKRIGVEVPKELLDRADEVFE